jgi:addiction module HigA family antidote
MVSQRMSPVHPGEILCEEFLKPLGLTPAQLARMLNVPPRHINELVRGKRRLSAEMALRLARCFDQSPQFWLGIQTRYDMDTAKDTASEKIAQEVQALFATPEIIQRYQKRLKEEGLEPGAVTGSLNQKTRKAIREYQAAHDLPETGEPNMPTTVILLEE